MKKHNLFSSFLLLLLMISCQQNQQQLITEKIVYDVQIRSTESDAEWWTENLPGPYRDKLISEIMDGVFEGRIIACTQKGKQLSAAEVKNIGSEEISIQLNRPDPPYETFDTVIKSELQYSDISHIRFLEEWHFDTHKNLISKNVLGLAPVMKNYDPEGNFRGYEALFWIYDPKAFTTDTQ